MAGRANRESVIYSIVLHLERTVARKAYKTKNVQSPTTPLVAVNSTTGAIYFVKAVFFSLGFATLWRHLERSGREHKNELKPKRSYALALSFLFTTAAVPFI
jgi:hypothetical protein